jgi:hypothetical protein
MQWMPESLYTLLSCPGRGMLLLLLLPYTVAGLPALMQHRCMNSAYTAQVPMCGIYRPDLSCSPAVLPCRLCCQAGRLLPAPLLPAGLCPGGCQVWEVGEGASERVGEGVRRAAVAVRCPGSDTSSE